MHLEIVVEPDCRECEEARNLAREIAAIFPDLRIELIDVDGERPIPSQVIATPTYLLGGKVISLGNPRRDDLVATILSRRPSDTPPVR